MTTDAETPNDTPNTEAPAVAPPARVFELTEAQTAMLKEHLDAGWAMKDRRRMPVRMKLGAPQLAQLGKEGAVIDEALHEKRQGKNARQAALIRERNERQGAIHSLSARLRSGVDEISKEMTIDQQAAYSQRVAGLRQELDDFEAARKEEMKELKDELAELEAQQQAISKKIRDGHGNVVTDVIDLIHYESGIVMILRLDTGGLVAKRALTEHERQLDLFTIANEFPPLDEHEYTLAVSGRLLDASRNYAERVHIPFDQAKDAVRRMLPDEELPPEVPAKTEAGKAADAKLLDNVESKEDGADPEETDSVEDTDARAKLAELATAAGEAQGKDPVDVLKEAAAEEEPADKVHEYRVVVTEIREGRGAHVIKALSGIIEQSVKATKGLVSTLPTTVFVTGRLDEADSVVQTLNTAGAVVHHEEIEQDEDADSEYVGTDAEDALNAEDEGPVDGIHRADDPTEALGYGKKR